MKFFITIGMILTFGTLLEARIFGYSPGDQDEWSLDSPECSGNRQYPIDIPPNAVESVKLPPLKLMGFDEIVPSNTFQVINTGHVVEFTINNIANSAPTPFVTGANLNGTYVFDDFHYHWGNGSEQRSEPAINGSKHVVLKKMMVFINNKNVTCESNENKYVVFEILYHLSNCDGLDLMPLIENIQYVQMVNVAHNVSQKFSLRFILGRINLGKFYTYQGSLTTPSCSQSITWITFLDELRVSESQVLESSEERIGNHGDCRETEFNNIFLKAIYNTNKQYISTPPLKYGINDYKISNSK